MHVCGTEYTGRAYDKEVVLAVPPSFVSVLAYNNACSPARRADEREGGREAMKKDMRR